MNAAAILQLDLYLNARSAIDLTLLCNISGGHLRKQ